MATLLYRLNRKNSEGSYDTIHYETSATVVLRPNQMTAEECFQLYDYLQGMSNTTTMFATNEVSQQGENFNCLTQFVNSAVIEQTLQIYNRRFLKHIEFNDVTGAITETITEG